MGKRTSSNFKLGIFVLSGLVFLILLLYMIGKNQSLFGSSFELKARFRNVQGLRAGDNIRFSGIQAGTVKEIKILNDSTIEVVMMIDSKMKKYIHKSAIASISTDGLIGNKLLNIIPSEEPAELVEDGDILKVRKTVDTGEMLQTLSKTNEDVAVIAAHLKTTVERINNSTAAWKILNDESLPENIHSLVANIRTATDKAKEMVNNLNTIVSDVKEGKGSLGAILTDSSLVKNLNEAILKIKSVGEDADSLSAELSRATLQVRSEVTDGKGPVTALLKDSAMTKNIKESLYNIQKGTDGFNDIMNAIKKSFLFRGYFKRLEKQKQKDPQ
ncbi:MAG: mammalian cell entry protein [Sphingobacteriales bacterium UTBCD1]|jgi:phospholipid/cholesterol/gamma-HCH transport system substrate-binding protein|nr:MAG: mammalian cell entry protein [Sphingobacteriales bacterium UTBCD1]